MDGEIIGGEPQDRDFSQAEIADAIQATFALCDTCAHAQSEHRDEGCCITWKDPYGDEQTCTCSEYWPIKEHREDGMRVIDHELGFGGALSLPLNRRLTSELWEMLSANQTIELRLASLDGWEVTAHLRVQSRGYKVSYDKGLPVGLVEVRKLKAERLTVARDSEDLDGWN